MQVKSLYYKSVSRGKDGKDQKTYQEKSTAPSDSGVNDHGTLDIADKPTSQVFLTK